MQCFFFSDAAAAEYRKTMRDLDSLELTELFSLVKCSADILNAVNWLPKGFLWSGKFNTFATGLFGLISSLVGLAQMILLS